MNYHGSSANALVSLRVLPASSVISDIPFQVFVKCELVLKYRVRM
jgi:hypothetical protein